LVRALSLYGCLVKTDAPVKQASKVALKIAHSGTQISALGRVVNCGGDPGSRGLGIEFTEMDANDKKRLEACLSDLAAAQKLPPVPSP
jgi:hypothetical protein